MNFTKNEKEMLKLLLGNGRATDVEIAEKLKISAQAVGKLRKKLEDNGVIEDYSCTLNFKKMGIGMFCVCLIKLKNKFFENLENSDIRDYLRSVPDTILTCIPSTSEISVTSVHGFRDAEEMEKYYYLVKSKFYDYFEVIGLYPFSPYNLIKNNSNMLFNLILDDKPIVPISLPK